MQLILVSNPRSGSAMPVPELRQHFANAGLTIDKHIPVSSRLKQQLAPYVDKSDVVIAAYGGDGTLSSIAGMLAGKKAAFAPLSGGTLNHFTKDLGIPQNLDDALAAIGNHKPRPIDIACVNDRTFVNNSSLGLYPSLIQMRDEVTRKQTFKWPAAVIASIKAFVRYRCYEVEIDGEHFTTPFIFVGNNDYKLENRLIGDRTSLNKGILSVYSVIAADRISLLRVVGRALIGKIESVDEVKIWKAKSLTIKTTSARIRISRDGEHEVITAPLTYRVIKGALNVIS